MKETEILFLGSKYMLIIIIIILSRICEISSRTLKNVGLLGGDVIEGNKHLMRVGRSD